MCSRFNKRMRTLVKTIKTIDFDHLTGWLGKVRIGLRNSIYNQTHFIEFLAHRLKKFLF